MENDIDSVSLATELTIAWLSNPNTRATSEDVPAFLASMHDAVRALATPTTTEEAAPSEPAAEHTPAVSVRKSLASRDHILSMIDGKPYKTLTRHLGGHGMTPGEYRARYGLKADYPMTAPAYSEQRRDMAKRIGLGRKPGETNAARAAAADGETPKRRGRKPAAAAAE